MKKLALVAFGVSLFAMTSCKKEYTCECTVTNGSTSVTTSTTSAKMKKKDAEDWCNQGDSSYSSCEIK